jgi:hypothetical protein
MKKLIILSALILSAMFSSPSFADWKKVGNNVIATFYVDYERIRKRGDYVYYWELIDFFKINSSGDLSIQSYNQADCNMFRYKILNAIGYPAHMAEGVEGNGRSQNNPDKNWRYPPPTSANETILKSVCAYAK